ncbi:NfrA family protein [Paraburkholderia acidisoli]|uniref:Bacteriophage N4 adsorption protein A n=1 Tax=Paraburkholderia acidisoli TaxID=2571748 RepID=A0A7Z2GP68_9BURK|nr:tetratricopeptide repeat protein [Paraburkholderia acidisoli]QGZ65385.1 bacteriophage N4 adsorption protein A [Paraburkholderia acidisoli]
MKRAIPKALPTPRSAPFLSPHALPRHAAVASLLAALLALHAPQARADHALPLPLAGAPYRVAREAYAAYDAHRYADSAALASEAIRQRPDVIELRMLLANALAADGHLDAAERSLSDAIDTLGPDRQLTARRAQIASVAAGGGGATDVPGPAGVAARAAYDAYSHKDYDAAIAEARRAIELAPEVERLRYLLIDALYADHRDEDAWAAIQDADAQFGAQDALRTRSEYVGARLAPVASNAAFSAREHGDLATAQTLAEKAVAYAPDRDAYRLQLLDVLFARGDYAGAEQAASDAIAANRNDVMAWTLRGYARAAQHEPAADSDFAQVLALTSANDTDTEASSDATKRTARDDRVARVIVADVRLAEHRPQDALDVLAPLQTQQDDTDAVIALRRKRAQRMLAANPANPANEMQATATAPLSAQTQPVFDCRADQYGASCDLYAADPAFADVRGARAATARGDHAAAVKAMRAAVAAVPDDPTLQLALIDALVANGNTRAARAAAREALASGAADGMAPLQTAYLAQRAGDSPRAYAEFARADAQGQLPPAAAGDAGYAALQSHHNAQGATWLEHAIDYGTQPPAGVAPMTDAALSDARHAHADATRNWGFTASVNYRGGGIQSGLASNNPTPGLENNWQAGTEAYWRPFGSLGERMFELYARGYENFGVKGDAPSGVQTLQTAIGARVKPFTSTNAIFAFERILPIGSAVQGDWLGRVAWSDGFGDDLRGGAPSWWTGTVYGEAGHYIQHPSTYATANARIGRTFRLDAISPNLTVFPHLVAGADYDSTIDHSVPVGIGAGVSARWWFRGGPYDAPRSFVDMTVQYRVRVAGDSRARGVFLGATFSY